MPLVASLAVTNAQGNGAAALSAGARVCYAIPMASLISSILSIFSGNAKTEGSAAPAAEPQTHGDCTIHATPIKEGNQFRLAGRIEKDINGETFVRNFIRADVFTSLDDALECTFRKAQQIIDQNGPALFADGERSRST